MATRKQDEPTMNIRQYLYARESVRLGVTEEKWLQKVLKAVDTYSAGHDPDEERTAAEWQEALSVFEVKAE